MTRWVSVLQSIALKSPTEKIAFRPILREDPTFTKGTMDPDRIGTLKMLASSTAKRCKSFFNLRSGSRKRKGFKKLFSEEDDEETRKIIKHIHYDRDGKKIPIVQARSSWD